MTDNVAKQRILDLTDNGLLTEEFMSEDIGGHNGLVTGKGYIGEKLCFFYSQNPDCKEEMINSEYIEKFKDVYKKGLDFKAPIIGIIDGEISRDGQYTNQLLEIAKSTSGFVPQYSVIYGKCIGGMVNVSAVSDFTIMRANAGEYHLTNVDSEPDEIRYNAQYCIDNGMVDLIGNKSMLNPSIKALVTLFQSNSEEGVEVANFEKEIKGMDKMLDDVSVLFMNLADEFKYIELKRNYVPELVTGFIKVNGNINAVIGNAKKRMTAQGLISYDGNITIDGCKKAIEFLDLCNEFKIPVLYTVDDESLFANVKTIEGLKCSGILSKRLDSGIKAKVACTDDTITIQYR